MSNPTVRLILRKDKINKQGEHPLYIRITQNRRSTYVSLKKWIRPEQWEEKFLRVAKSHPNSKRLNAFIQSKLAEANKEILEQELKAKDPKAHQIKDKLKGIDSTDFFQYFEKYLHRCEQAGQIGSFRKGSSILKKLKAYVKRATLYFDEITVSFLKSYEQYLREVCGNKTNTVYSDIKVIRKLYKEAADEGLTKHADNPFLRYKLKWAKTNKPYLTEEELSRIEKLDLSGDSVLDLNRDMFVFASYVGGIRISDLLLLKWEDFDGEKITFQIRKTKEMLSIKLPKKGLALIEKYRPEKLQPDSIIFPFLKEHDPTNSTEKYSALSSSTAYLNKNLKRIGELAEISFPLTTHVARHTWATRALRKGMRIEYVSKLMAHSNIKTTQVYAKIVNEELDKAMDVFDD